MFATLLGGLPRPLDADGVTIADDDRAVAAVLEAQATAGLGPLTDGRLRWRGAFGPIAGLGGIVAADSDDPMTGGLGLDRLPTWVAPLAVGAWQFAASHAAGLVKQALPGPYTLGRRLGGGDRDAATEAFAGALNRELRELAEAGCAFIEIEELDADRIGTDASERRLFASAHRRLLDGLGDVHVSLALVGGNAEAAGVETILAAPYPSLAVDLIAGPDNWRLVTSVPGDRGVICGALSPREPADDGPEVLVWAASYAASSRGRGLARTGLATAGGLEALAWPAAVRKMERLGEAAQLAGLPLREAAHDLDPRMLDRRRGALGWYPGPEDATAGQPRVTDARD
jgi:methionine synthase II (cobalamin-independent)